MAAFEVWKLVKVEDGERELRCDDLDKRRIRHELRNIHD